MTIPENQFKMWSHLGTQVRSHRTYESVRNALQRHEWPPDMGSPSVYLQGSYRNHTNIAGDSDVDVVVESADLFYDNLSPEERQLRGFQLGRYSWVDFRDEVFAALAANYSHGRVRQGNKSIRVNGAGDRLNADVIPCCEYRAYASLNYTKGITFWTQSGTQVVNYPQLHYENGAHKSDLCRKKYKAMIRVFKNARNVAESRFPSYFLECLLHNVSPSQYSGTRQEMFFGILVELHAACANGTMAQWKCQNGVQPIFGGAIHQTEFSSANRLIDALVSLWNNWR